MNNEYSAIYKRWTRFLKENNLFVNYVTYVVEKCFSYTTIHNLHSIFYIKNGLRDDLSNIDYIESFRDNLPWWTNNLFLKFEESNKKFLRKKSLYRQKKRNMGLNNEPWYKIFTEKKRKIR